MVDVRGTYYELYFDNQLEYTGTLEECQSEMVHALDDDLAEIYEVQLTEEKIA
tara:strand:+ start:225 stop:383 length:159 start_codon:yes stop_codon:yes gene_type:complete